MKRRQRSTSFRRGAIAVEFAVTAPFVVLLFLGAVQMGGAIRVRQSLQDAARAGCRVYSVKGTTQAEAEAVVAQSLESAGVGAYTLEFKPASKSGVDKHLEPVNVRISVDYDSVSWLPSVFLKGRVLVADCTLPADLEDVAEPSPVEPGGATWDPPVDPDEVSDNLGDDDDDDD